MKKIHFLLLFSLLSLIGFAQNGKFRVDIETDNAAPLAGQQFTIVYKLVYQGNSIQLSNPRYTIKKPKMDDFTIIQEGQSDGFNMNFGRNGIEVYSYIYKLRAKKEGNYTIGPMTIALNGKKYSSKALKVNVGKPDPKAKVSAKANERLFLRAIPSKRNPYVGEAISLSFRLYFKVNVNAYEVTKAPTHKGFWGEEFEKLNVQGSQRSETVNGQQYSSVEIYRKVLFAQRAGELTIDPMEIDVQYLTGRSSGGFFSRPEAAQVSIKSPRVKLNVKALPVTGKPADFNGLVGNYKVDHSLSNTSLNANDATNLKINIKGSGNIQLIELPQINFHPDLEVYEPKTSFNIQVGRSNVSGNKSFEWVIIPRRSGDFSLKIPTISYFNPATQSYESIDIAPYEIKAGKGGAINEDRLVSTSAKEDIQYLGKEFRFIKSGNLNLHQSHKNLIGSTLYFLLIVLIIGGGTAFYFVYTRMQTKKSDTVLMKNKKASKAAVAKLKTAQKLISTSNSAGFYEEVSNAMIGFVGDRLNMSQLELNRDNLRLALIDHQLNGELVGRYMKLLSDCDFARFAPGQSTQSPQQTYDEAVALLSEIQKKI